jgi:hypothetical protein
MCLICDNKFEGNKILKLCCPLLTNIPNIEGLEYLDCSNCPLLTHIPNIKELEKINCSNCPLLTNIPNIKGLKELDCSECSLLTFIPDIKKLKELDCSNCPVLTHIPTNNRLKRIYCRSCPLLTKIPNNKNLKTVRCFNCPQLMYIPNIIDIIYDNDLLNIPFEESKYLTNKKINIFYNTTFKLWKLYKLKYKLKSYALYLEREIYSNPRLPYMEYYINNEFYDKPLDNTENLKIGYINKENKLIWYSV